MQSSQPHVRDYVQSVFLAAAMLFGGAATKAQTAPRAQAAPKSQTAPKAQGPPTAQSPQEAWAEELRKYPGIQDEFAKLIGKAMNDIQYPPPRSESRLMPLLPPSTMFYGSISNYGQAADQALKILHQEMQESPVFRDWWQHGEMATAGPKIEDAFQKFSELNSYLGDEIVIAGTVDAKEPNFQLIAEVREPGLKKYLEQLVPQIAGNSKPTVRILDPQELAAAKEQTPATQQVILVRPEYLVIATNLASLRTLNVRLDQRGREFVSTPFGQRVTREYQGGVTMLAAADLQKILNQAPPATQQNAAFQQSGFADMKYIVWEHRLVAGKGLSQFELSFNGPRHGAASWLAKSTPLGTLDYVSPDAMMAFTVVLSNPALIFDDIKALTSISNPQAFAALPMFEQALHVSVKDDLLGLLRGEVTVEVDSATPPQPVWKAILAVKDADRLQQTLDTLMTAAHFTAQQSEERGVTYSTVKIPTPKAVVSIAYAFVDGNWILGSSRAVVADAVALHRSGGSLGKSKKLLASLPPGQALSASGMFYQDPVAMTAMRLQQAMPGLADSFLQNRKVAGPGAVWIYGEDSAIREVSTNATFDAGAVLIGAAIAIPNLMRSKVAANEASAIANLRTINVAQVTYRASYPQRGFASTLSVLGGNPNGSLAASPEHAALLDESLASQSCSPDGWCLKDGFRFKIAAACIQGKCPNYVAFAVPVSSNTGNRNFCSTSDGVIRFQIGAPWTGPFNATECKAWAQVE